VNIEQIIDWILANGHKYPGKHNQSTQRTSPNLKPLQPKAQFIIIWKALIEYVGNNIRAGRSVNIKKFGCFTFNVQTELPKIHG
jgi:nucleoid DNA-binding protein